MAVLHELHTQRVWMSGRGSDAWRVVLDEQGRGRLVRGSQSIGFGSVVQLQELRSLLAEVKAEGRDPVE